MQRLKLVERAKELEPYVRGKLEALKAKHPSVGDVRGLGLFFAVELVKNRETKEPFNTMRDKVEGKPLVVEQIAAKMMADGVAQQAWVSHFVIAPPLIVTKEEIDFGIDAFDRHLVIADELVKSALVEHHRLVSVAENAPVEMPAHGARQHQPLEVASPRNQIFDLIAVRDARHVLLDDRPVVENFGDIVARRSDQLHAALDAPRGRASRR